MKKILSLVAAVAGAVALASCTPHVEGDSLTFNASYPTNYVTGATVKGNIGHDPCQDEQDIVDTANARKPDRLVLAYVGNPYSPQVAPAYAAYRDYGLGQAYANCYRDIRTRIPAATQLVVTEGVAAVPSAAPRGSAVVNTYTRVATLGGTYPSGVRVAPLPNSRYSTALDDRLTPGHVFRWGDSGGTLRSADGLHLTDYGARVYGGVLSQIAAGLE